MTQNTPSIWTPFTTLNVILTFIAVMLMPFCTARAQSNSEYNFQQVSVPDQSAGANSSTDTVINLTMDCLAANGYGQWTTSTQTNSPTNKVQSGWFLLGNSINTDQLDNTAHIPPGVVTSGSFLGNFPISTSEVVCNLNGQTRYVGMDFSSATTQGLGFYAQGLNDERGPSSPTGQQQINISLQGIPNPPITRQVVKDQIFQYSPTIPVGVIVGGITTLHTPVSLGVEPDYRDIYHCACDANFFYVVWATTTNTTGGASEEIWGIALDINTMQPAAGYTNGPILLSPVGVTGKRPTVACNPRNAPTSPQFDVAFVNSSGAVVVQEFLGTTIVTGHQETLQKKFADPFSLTPADDTYTTATRARVAVSSIFGSSTSMHCVYVLADPIAGIPGYDYHDLLYKGLTGGGLMWAGDKATYVDGQMNNFGNASYPPPVASATPVYMLDGIKDQFIEAIANPYDNQTGTYNQFHCLYEPQYSRTGGVLHTIQIERGFDNGFLNAGATDSRLILNQGGGSVLSGSLLGFRMAVNQMGIHVHWRNSSGGSVTHYYSRDLNRAFDEPIEEHTLATYECRVTNGTSHGGTMGATLQPGAILTLWTDPNWFQLESLHNSGSTITAQGSFYPNVSSFSDGYLSFVGNDVTLNVGANESDFPGPATFVMAPNTFCNFPVAYTGQGITVNPNGIFDYFAYGIPQTETTSGLTASPDINSSRNLFYIYPDAYTPFLGAGYFSPGNGTISLNGKLVSGTAVRAVLNLHGGSRFVSSGYGSFTSDYGDIESLFESNDYPTWYDATTPQGGDYSTFYANTDYMNAPTPGVMDIYGTTSITNTVINSHEMNANGSDREFDDIISIFGNSNRTNPVTLSNDVFTNTESASGSAQGLSRLIFYKDGNDWPANFPEIDISSCTFDSWQVASYNPVNTFSLSGSTFKHTRNAGVNLQRDRSLMNDYDNLSVSSNDFQTFRDPSSYIDPALTISSNDGIFASGFDKSLMVGTSTDPGYHPRMLVEANTFTATTDNNVQYAIYLDNSNTSVLSNEVSKSTYSYGIYNSSSDFPKYNTTSFLCSNTISHCSQVGIYTAAWKGYSKLNDVSACTAAGHESYGDAAGAGVVFCDYHSNTGPGLAMTASSHIDMSGVHGGSNNYAGYNTVSANNSTNSSTSGQITLSGGVLIIGTNGTPSSTYGNNNIVSNSTSSNLIYAPASGTNIGGIDENYWGNTASYTLFGTSDALLPNIVYSSFGTNPICASSTYSISGVTCGIGFNEKIETKGPIPLVANQQSTNTDSTECAREVWHDYSLAQGDNYQQMYDTGRYVIEHCAASSGRYSFPPLSIWDMFGPTTTGCQYLSTDPNRWPPYREWLKKVLYYNPDSNYYCEDVKSILTTMSYFNAERGWDHNGALAIVQFLVDSGRCLSFLGDVNQSWRATRLAQLQTWRDTVKDQQATPFSQDTMDMPSLEDLDLQILRGPQYRAVTDAFSASHAGPKITYLIADENPFDRQTTLRFGLVDAEYMRIDLYDPLGKALYSDTRLCGEGENRWHIPGESLPHGTIYARISTMSGDVKTVKLIRL